MSGDFDNSLSDWRPGEQWRPQGPEQVNTMDPAAREAYEEAARRYIFGQNYRRDAQGRPLEDGIGSPNNMTFQAKAARAKAEGRDADLRRKAGLE
jgi:hypothetical protein